MDMTVGTRIVEARKARGMSRPELSRASGVPYPTLAGLENGDQQSSTAIPAIAQVLHVSAVWLATGRGSRPSLNASPSAHVPENFSSTKPPVESHFTGPDPAILHEAVTLLLFDLDHGKRGARSASDLLLDLYRRCEAGGGRLPAGEQKAFEDAARSRGKSGEHAEPKARKHATRKPGRRK